MSTTSHFPGSEQNENEFPIHSPPIPSAPSRSPLHTIPDPSQNPRDPQDTTTTTTESDSRPNFKGTRPKKIESSTYATPKGGTIIRGPSSAQSTPTRSVGKASNGGAGIGCRQAKDARGGGNSSKVFRGILSGVTEGVTDVPHFELVEDPLFWMDHNVQVLVRIRPINSSERALQGNTRCLRQENAQTLTWLGHPETRFIFDNVACETISQEKLFKVAGLPMVENCMSGYNSCMFAYGQTGSGKTYTMMGELHEMDGKLNEDCGMTPRIFEYLFTRIRSEEECRSDEKLKYSCKCSFLEIYNEHITDLLEPSSTNLQIREDMRKGVYVENLTEYEVTTVKDVLQLLQKGATNRKMAATNMNSESSRSHSVFTCIIESQWDMDSMTHFRFGRLNLVDLAGSERQKSSGAEGERLKEAANINKSLSTLGLVINTLVVVAHGKHRHVPYRDSRLTFLLQDSLGGNSKTTIIANISPSTCSANESLSTLKFAQRAKLIQNNAKVNEDASGDVTALQRQIQQLKGQLNFLVKHQNYSSSLSSSLPNLVTSQFGDINEIDESSLDEKIFDHLNNRSIPQKKIRHIKATLVGALRREKMAETAVGKLEAEIKHMDRLVHQQEEDAQRTKMILRFHEDKIKRLEMLSDGLVSADEYLMEENCALSEEIQLLQEKIDRNPELTRFALENLRLLEQLRMYQDFYEQGEREMMLAEISELRDQLKETLEGKLKSPSRKANQVETVSIRSDSEDEIASHSHFQVKINEKMDHVLDLQASGAQKELIDAWTLIEGLEQQQVYLMEELDILQKKSFQYEEIWKKKDFEESQSQLILGGESNSLGKHHKTEDPVRPNVGLLMEGSENFITSGLQAKLDRLNRELKEARIMNQQYRDDCASQIFHQNEVEQVREQVEVETAKTILHLQEELTTLQQEFKDELFIMTEENTKLINTIEAREEEIRMLTEEWEKAMLELTGFLIDGCRSLEDASDHIESIARSLPEREVWIGKRVERAVKIFVEKEKTIKQLQKSLEEAQEMCMELKLKLNSLQGATLALTEVRQLENDENTREVMELQTLLREKTSKIKELESKLESMEDQIIEAGQSLELVEEGEAGCSNTREMLHLSLDDARFIFDEKFKINNSFLSKFEEAHSTLEEADLMLNALLKANENAKLMTDTWKRAGEELMIERVGLIEEVQQLKSSIFLKEGVYESMQDHMHAGLVEIAEMVSSLEVSFVQMKRDVEERFRIVYSDISSLGQDLLHCICNFRASVEDIWSEMVENGFALFVLCQCYAGHSFKKISFDKSGPSLFQHRQQKCYSIVNDVKKGCTSAREKCIIEENSENMQYELSNPRDNLELQNQYEMVHNLKVEELSMSPSNMMSENLLLKKELARKDDILKGLLFDISLLQESASNSKDIKDEIEQMFTALTRAQHELLLKTTLFDDIVLRHRQLEEMLMNSETALSISNSELGKAKETIDIFTKQNFELRTLLKDLHDKLTNTEEQLEEQKEIVKSLEKENLRIAFSVEERILSSLEKVEDELRRVTEERDHLLEEVATMNDKLEMAHALADENEAIAVEARHESEASKVYAEQKEEEAKILERSVEELEHTINVLERKVYEMSEEVQRHHLMRDDVELELQDLRLRMQTVQNFTQIFNPENSDVEQKLGECEELTKHIRILETERADQAREIKECRKYISELVLHAEAQASQYQQKYKMLEDMVHAIKRDPSASTSAPSTLDKTEKGSTRPRGSSSPFRCITNLVQQMNLEKDQELSVARLRIEELEALACSRQKEVCMLNARLAAADNMTHDVIRDLLGVKLDMTNYANLIDQHQVQELVEGAQRQTEEYIAKEQEILQLRKQINDLVEERQSCIEELNQRESDILAAQLTLEQHKQRDQMLKAQNEMLKMDKTNLKRKITEMDEMLKNHCGTNRFKQPMQQPGKMKENGPLRTSNNEFGKSLTHSENRLSRVNEELAWYCQSNSRDRYEVEEQRLRNKRQGAQECEDQ